jgi:hypothetical protein
MEGTGEGWRETVLIYLMLVVDSFMSVQEWVSAPQSS